MKSPNQQYLIAQELSKIFSNGNYSGYNIIGYEFYGEYKIAITSNCGMFSGVSITDVVKLSQEFNLKFYISSTCSASDNYDFYLIVY